MNILVGQNHLDTIGGSEKFCYTLVGALKKHGYNVNLLLGDSRRKGIVSDRIERDFGVREGIIDVEHDIALLSHNTTVMKCKALNIMPQNTYQIVHGVYPKLEQPCIESGARFISVSEEIQEYLKVKYDSDSILMRNPIDINKFERKSPISKAPKKVLSLCQNDFFNTYLSGIFNRIGMELISLNKHRNPIFDVETEINQADMVVTLGRGCYESMTSGRNILIADQRGYHGKPLSDGMLTGDNFSSLITKNCSGRYSQIFPSEEFIDEQISLYSIDNGENMVELSLKHLCSDKVVEKLLNDIKIND